MAKYNPSLHNDARPNVEITVVPLMFDLNYMSIKTLIYSLAVDSEQFAGKISLPNGVYDCKKVKTVEGAAENALRDKLNISIPHMEQLYTFSGDYIDPGRINTINITFFSILRKDDVEFTQNPLFESKWVSIDKLLAMPDDKFAFNHKEVLEIAYERVKSKAEYVPLALQLLPELTTIPDFKFLTELLIGGELNNSRFRDRIKKSGILIEVEGKRQAARTRRSQVYQANPKYVGEFYPRSLTKPA